MDQDIVYVFQKTSSDTYFSRYDLTPIFDCTSEFKELGEVYSKRDECCGFPYQYSNKGVDKFFALSHVYIPTDNFYEKIDQLWAAANNTKAKTKTFKLEIPCYSDSNLNHWIGRKFADIVRDKEGFDSSNFNIFTDIDEEKNVNKLKIIYRSPEKLQEILVKEDARRNDADVFDVFFDYAKQYFFHHYGFVINNMKASVKLINDLGVSFTDLETLKSDAWNKKYYRVSGTIDRDATRAYIKKVLKLDVELKD